MKPDNTDIIRALAGSVEELQQRIDSQRCLIAAILTEKLDDNTLAPLREHCARQSREARLEQALRESIDILEESRKAFKSKQLELLRKKLIQVLTDAR